MAARTRQQPEATPPVNAERGVCEVSRRSDSQRSAHSAMLRCEAELERHARRQSGARLSNKAASNLRVPSTKWSLFTGFKRGRSSCRQARFDDRSHHVPSKELEGLDAG